MSFLPAFSSLTRAHVLMFLRSRAALVWTLAFPQFFLFMFEFAFSGGTPRGATYLMPGLFTITLISGSFFGVALRMVTERETGVLRRHRVTPVPAVAVILSHGATALVVLACSVTLQAVVARLVFRIGVAGSAITLVIVLLLGGLALVPIGMIAGSIARDTRAAPAITNFLFFPMMFLSGAAIPFPFLPAWMQRLARLVPTTYLVESLQGVMVRGQGLGRLRGPLLVLALMAAIGIGLNGLLFRWESTEPVRRGRVTLALSALLLVCWGAYFLAPPLEMSQRPFR